MSDNLQPAEYGDGRLTEAQVSILYLIARGFTNARIAKAVGVRPYRAKEEVRVILHRLGANSRQRAVYEGFRLGILHVPEES